MLFVDISFVVVLFQKEYHVYSESAANNKTGTIIISVTPSIIVSVTASEIVGVVSSRKAIFEFFRLALS